MANKVCALTWDFTSGAVDINNWTLVFSQTKTRWRGSMVEQIEGENFNELLVALNEISSQYNNDFKFYIYVKNLRGFERIGENFIMWNGECELTGDLKPFYINSKLLPKIEFRNWDFFFKDVDNANEFLKNLFWVANKIRTKTCWSKEFRFTLTRELWSVVKKGYGLKNDQQISLQNTLKFSVNNLMPDETEFDMLKDANRAGLLYVNPKMEGITVEDAMRSYDISSSHIGFMVRKLYPHKRLKSYSNIKDIQFLNSISNCAWIGRFVLQNIKPKTNLNIDLSKFNCAGNKYFVFTNVDWNWFKQLYNFDFIGILNLQTYSQSKQPDYWRFSLSKLYEAKQNAPKPSFERDITKLMCEIPYGHSIKTPFYKRQAIYNEQDNSFGVSFIKDDDISFQSIKKKLMTNGLPYQWGIWTVAYSVSELITLIIDVGVENTVYCDTDSIKFLDDGAGLGDMAIELRNSEIQAEKDAEWIAKDLGIWKDEGSIKCFKAIGSKWYLWTNENDELEVKCAGANKDIVLQWLQEQRWPYAFFNDATNMGCNCFKTITYPAKERTFYITNGGAMNKELKKEFVSFTKKNTRGYDYSLHSWGTFET